MVGGEETKSSLLSLESRYIWGGHDVRIRNEKALAGTGTESTGERSPSFPSSGPQFILNSLNNPEKVTSPLLSLTWVLVKTTEKQPVGRQSF